MASLPPFTLNGWRLQQGEEGRAKAAKQLKEFTTSSLAETFMTFQLDKYHATLDRRVSAPSLASLAVGEILETLENSENSGDLKTVAESLSSTTLRALLDDPRTPYLLLRNFLALDQTTLAAKDRSIVDVDEAVLRNEHYNQRR